MLCPNCGTENPDDARNCKKCGQALPSTSAAEAPYAGEWKDDPDLVHAAGQGKRRKKRGRRIVLAVVLVAILLAVGLLGGRVVLSRLYSTQVTLAQQMLSDKKYSDAADALEKAIKLQPKEQQAYLLVEQAFSGTQDYDTGVSLLEQGVKDTGAPAVQTALTEMKSKQEDAHARAEQEKAAQQAAAKLHWAVQPTMVLASVEEPGAQPGKGSASFAGMPDYSSTVLVKEGSTTRLLGYDGKDRIPDGYTVRFCDTCGVVAQKTGAQDAQEWLVGPDGTVLGPHTDAATQQYVFQNGAVCLSGSGEKAESWNQTAILPVLSKSGAAAGYAFIDSDGKQVGDTYTSAGIFSEGLAAVQKDGKWGYVDHTGAEKIPFLFDKAYPFQEGLAAVVLDGKAGFIQPDGTLSLGFSYQDARSPYGGRAWVKQDGKWGVLDLQTTGKSTDWAQVYLQKLQDLDFSLTRPSVEVGLWDFNGDGTPELFLSDGTLCTVYTVGPGSTQAIGVIRGERLYAGSQSGQLLATTSNVDTFNGALAALGGNDAARSLNTCYDSGVLSYRINTSGVTGQGAVLLAMSSPPTYLQDGKTVEPNIYRAALDEACPSGREVQMTRLTPDRVAALDETRLRALEWKASASDAVLNTAASATSSSVSSSSAWESSAPETDSAAGASQDMTPADSLFSE